MKRNRTAAVGLLIAMTCRGRTSLDAGDNLVVNGGLISSAHPALRRTRVRYSRLLTSLVALAVASPATTWAELVPATDEFQVNTVTTNWQYVPRITPLAGDEFVVVWEDFNGNYFHPVVNIHGQRITRDGDKLGGELLVTEQTTSLDYEPAVAASDDGKLVVAWKHTQSQYSLGRAMARIYDEQGDPIGAAFLLDPTGLFGDQRHPSTAFVAADEFVVVWSNAHIFGRRILDDGTFVGDRFDVSTTAGYDAEVAARPDGSFVVAWASAYTQFTTSQIFARRFDPTGEPLGDELPVNADTIGWHNHPHLALTDDGGFVVVWTARPLDFATRTVMSRQFGADGSPVGADSPVSDAPQPYEDRARAVSGVGGSFVVTWSSAESVPDGSYYETMVRRFASTGAAAGPSLVANVTTEENQDASAIVADGPDAFVVVWESTLFSTGTSEIFGRRLEIPAAELCGDPDQSASVTASDALHALDAAIGLESCFACVCDVNGSGRTTALDALIELDVSVGQPVELACAACEH